MSQHLSDRFFDGKATSFASSSLPHSIRPGMTGEIVVAASGFQVILPSHIVDAIAAVRNDPRWGIETDNCRK